MNAERPRPVQPRRTKTDEVREQYQYRETPVDVGSCLGRLRLGDRTTRERGQRDRQVDQRDELEDDVDGVPARRRERQERRRE